MAFLTKENAFDALFQRMRVDVNESAEKFIKESVEEYEKQLREKMGERVLGLLNYYDVHMDGHRLVISVDIKEPR